MSWYQVLVKNEVLQGRLEPEICLCCARDVCTSSQDMTLPTKGRVIIDTTAGEIDIELWSKVS